MKKIPFLLAALCICMIAAAQPTSFGSRGVGGGGALFFPRINPANDNEFYIACDMSEMFHSTNYGDSYSHLPFTSFQSMNVSTYEFTNNPMVAYSNFNDGNEGYPVRTNDGGATWTPLYGFDASEGMIYSMASNYNKPEQLLMDYYGQIVFSNDSGQTFSVVHVADDMGAGVIMGGTFFDGSDIWIGTNDGLFHSSNSGTSFSLVATTGIPSGSVIWQFAGATSGGTTRFACVTGSTSDVYNGVMPWDYWGLADGVYVMDNASGTWVSKSSGIDFTNDFVPYIGMAWNDISTIYLAGCDGSMGSPLIMKSATGGDSWTKVFQSAGNTNVITGWCGTGGDKQWTWGEAAFGVAVAPFNSSKVLFGSFSDVHTTNDGGANWTQAYVDNADEHPAGASTPTKQNYHSIGLENTTCWQVIWQGADKMLGAFSDIGLIRSQDSGTSWSFNYTGISVNSTYRIAKTTTGTLFAGTSGIHDMYQSTRLKDAQLDAADASGNISYSTDNGATWSLMHSFGHPVFWVAVDPNNINTVYASVIHYSGGGSAQGGIYQTTDANNLGSSAWVKLPDPPRVEGHPASIVVLNDGKVVCTYSGRITGSSTFTASSGVFLYDPAGAGSWSDVSDPNMYYWTKDIIIDPNDATQNTWYACVFSGWGGLANDKGGLYKTTNRGTSWTKLTGTQFDRVTSVTFNPSNLNQAYLTTETQGLWVSSDMDATTPTWTLVTGYTFRQPERVFFNPFNTDEMWVTSFGNGMRLGSMSGTGIAFNAPKEPLQVYPNPAGDVLTVGYDKNIKQDHFAVYDASGKVVLSGEINTQNQVNVRTLAPGSYFISVGNKTAKFVKQ